MRDLELVLVVVAAVAALRPWTPLRRSRVASLVLGVLPTAAAIVQMVAEGGRWQLVPLWIAAGMVLALAIRDVWGGSPRAAGGDGGNGGSSGPPVEPRRISPLLAGLTVGSGALLTWALPIVALPTPTGPFTVGTTTTVLIDEQRTERYGTNPGGPRVLPLQVWYPGTTHQAAAPSPWLVERDEVTAAAARDLGLPAFALDHLTLIPSNSHVDAPPIPGGDLPIVVYAHGWSGTRELQATQLESLASHGYLVIAADHTHAALATRLPDGTIGELDERALPDGVPQEEYDEAAERLVATFADDLTAILDAVLEDGLLDDLVEVERLTQLPVGFLGHSTGGGAAILACSRDERCGAVIGYDPWVTPVPDEVIGRDLGVPVLSLRSEEWVGTDNDVRLRRLHAGSSAPEGRVEIAGINHRDLTLLPLLSPLNRTLGLSGPRADEGSFRALDRWTVGFLGHHLRGFGRDPLSVAPNHDHTRLEKANGEDSGPVNGPG